MMEETQVACVDKQSQQWPFHAPGGLRQHMCPRFPGRGIARLFAASFDVFDAGRRVSLQLPPSLPQQEFDGSEVTLLHGKILLKLGSAKPLSPRLRSGGSVRKLT